MRRTKKKQKELFLLFFEKQVLKMKRILQVISNIGIIFTVLIIIVIVMHFIDDRSTVEIGTLLNLLIIVCETQMVSAIMDHVIIKPMGLHMFTELLVMEGVVLITGYLLGVFDFEKLYYIFVYIFIIAFVYAFTVMYYWISAKYAANEINQYLLNKK